LITTTSTLSTRRRSTAYASDKCRRAIAVVRDAVNHAFLDGLQAGSLVCAGIALGAAVVVAVLLPARGEQATAPAPTPALAEVFELSD
jgi:hypothetical protein